MPSTTAQKLKIKEGFTLLTLHAPKEFKTGLGDLPSAVKISDKAKTYQQIHWFVKDRAQLEEEKAGVLNLLHDDTVCWIYFPKGSSKLRSDLSRDSLWETFSGKNNVQFLNLVSFNETWSAFALRLKTAAASKKEAAPKERPVAPYIDTVKRIVYLPNDFSAALQKAPNEKAFFETLSFTNRKEYVEWIVSAKKEETRTTRVQESVSRLANGWKNPANR